MDLLCPEPELLAAREKSAPAVPVASPASPPAPNRPPRERSVAGENLPARLRTASARASEPQLRCNEHGWLIPSLLSPDPEEARTRIPLPDFDPLLLEKARVISGRFPQAEAQYRNSRGTETTEQHPELPHFERVFRIASAMASVHGVEAAPDYDALLVLTAWHCVRPQAEGFLGSYPKSVLCTLSHSAPPAALASLSPFEQSLFERRAGVYLRCLILDKFGLRTCADIEHADLRHLLRSAGFRLVRSSAVAELAFPGITCGEDPPVRPWKLTLRQELSDDRAAELLITAALWQVRYGLRLVTIEQGEPRWNIGAFGRTDWEDAFLSLGVRVAPSLLRESGLFDWRAVLTRCIQQLGQGNLPPEVLGKVSAWPQRICHDDNQAIWELLDRVAHLVLERVRVSEPQLFSTEAGLDYEAARGYRRWAQVFDEVSPQILSRLGVSAFTALQRVAPEMFGWEPGQLKPWELEQEHGKWKGPRGRALLRSAYAFALHESGLGTICRQSDQVLWQCTTQQFSQWYTGQTAEAQLTPYELLYGLASQHGLTPLLNRDITHTAAVSLLAGVNVHQNLPKIEGCWELCMHTALAHHGGKLEVRLALPDLVPLPLRLRKAVLTPLTYTYLHKELRLVRDFDLRMAHETHRKLEEIPGWWEDERVAGTALEHRLQNRSDPARTALERLVPDPWLEPRHIRFGAFYSLLSRRATTQQEPGNAGLSSEEIRALLRLAFEATLPHTNVVHVSFPAVTRGFERILAREDTREMLDALLLHIGTACETEIWGHARKTIVFDVINDLLAITVRCSLLHLMSGE